MACGELLGATCTALEWFWVLFGTIEAPSSLSPDQIPCCLEVAYQEGAGAVHGCLGAPVCQSWWWTIFQASVDAWPRSAVLRTGLRKHAASLLQCEG